MLLVHDREAEEKFVADGYGVERLDVMHNDFVLVGPRGDPARARGAQAAEAFRQDRRRRRLLRFPRRRLGHAQKGVAAVAGGGRSPSAPWYLESGSGMEATLRIANEKRAYCLVDRATWLAHRGEIDALVILVEGDEQLFNPYSVIVVSPAKFSWVNAGLAARFADFIRSPEGQAIIRDFGRERFGGALFFPDVVR